MAESGIFRVSIPRPSVHTGPGTSVKSVDSHEKKNKTQLLKTKSRLNMKGEIHH